MRRGGGITSVLAALLLPASILPLLAAKPLFQQEYRSFAYRYKDRPAHPAPEVQLTPQQQRTWRPLPEYQGAVPVLTYHGINAEQDGYSVSPRQFALHMAMLHRAGFHAISPGQYIDYLQGETRGLPVRPILITFDDGRYDSFAGADQVLRRWGMRATMFVITERASQPESRFYLSWSELRRMQRNGRWDLQLHAGTGHRLIASGPRRQGPFYTRLAWRNGVRESLAGWQNRVRSDILQARQQLAEHIPGYEPLLFALPYGDYGQQAGGDPQLRRQLLALLSGRFAVTLAESPAVFSGPDDLHGVAQRFPVRTRTSAQQLYRWLRSGLPFRAWTAPERAAHQRRVAALRRAAGCHARVWVVHGRGQQLVVWRDGRLVGRDGADPLRVRVRLTRRSSRVRWQLQRSTGVRRWQARARYCPPGWIPQVRR